MKKLAAFFYGIGTFILGVIITEIFRNLSFAQGAETVSHGTFLTYSNTIIFTILFLASIVVVCTVAIINAIKEQRK